MYRYYNSFSANFAKSFWMIRVFHRYFVSMSCALLPGLCAFSFLSSLLQIIPLLFLFSCLYKDFGESQYLSGNENKEEYENNFVSIIYGISRIIGFMTREDQLLLTLVNESLLRYQQSVKYLTRCYHEHSRI